MRQVVAPATRQVVVPLQTEASIVEARQAGRDLARELGFSPVEVVIIVTAISEMARAAACGGQLVLRPVQEGGLRGIEVLAQVPGAVPGAAEDPGSGCGDGLPGVRHLMDEVQVTAGDGDTTMAARKWRA